MEKHLLSRQEAVTLLKKLKEAAQTETGQRANAAKNAAKTLEEKLLNNSGDIVEITLT